jgi:hypothetical protein
MNSSPLWVVRSHREAATLLIARSMFARQLAGMAPLPCITRCSWSCSPNWAHKATPLEARFLCLFVALTAERSMMDLRQSMLLSAKFFWSSLVKWTPLLLVTFCRLVSLVAVLSVLLNFVTGATVDYSDIFNTRTIDNPSQDIMQDD